MLPPFGVEDPDRSLKQSRLRCSLRRRPLEDVEPVLVHRDVDERARLVAIRQLQEVAFDHLLELEVKIRDLGASRCMYLRAANVIAPRTSIFQ